MGPLCFGRGSHRKRIGRDLEISAESEQQIRDAVRKEKIDEVQEPFALGDVSFHLGWTLHRAGPNTTTETAPRVHDHLHGRRHAARRAEEQEPAARLGNLDAQHANRRNDGRPAQRGSLSARLNVACRSAPSSLPSAPLSAARLSRPAKSAIRGSRSRIATCHAFSTSDLSFDVAMIVTASSRTSAFSSSASKYSHGRGSTFASESTLSTNFNRTSKSSDRYCSTSGFDNRLKPRVARSCSTN